jgi:Tfp pilus assembly pilus retraction ATPase PilT
LEPEQEATAWVKGVAWRLCMAPLSIEKMSLLLHSLMDDQQWKILADTGEIEFSHAPDPNGQQLRIKVFRNQGLIRLEAHPTL